MADNFKKDNKERMIAALAVYLGLTDIADYDKLSDSAKAAALAAYKNELGLKDIVEQEDRLSERDIQMKIADIGNKEGIKLYRIVGEDGDGHQCERCKRWQGEIVSMTDNAFGYKLVEDFINDGGFHINCRCSLQELDVQEIPRKTKEWLGMNSQPTGGNMTELKDTLDNGESEVQVATIGDVLGSDADGKPVEQHLTEESLKKLAEAHKDEEILVDVDHESELGGKTEAKGWLSSLEVKPGIGLFGKIKWTDIGRKLIENRVFRWLSPSWWLDKNTREPVKLSSVALTNKPSQAGMIDPIINSAPVKMEEDKDLETQDKGILDMTKEELEVLIADVVAKKLAEAKEAEVKEEVKEEVIEETTENACSEETKEEVKNDEPVVTEEKKEVVEEEKKEVEEPKEEVIKLEALNSTPKTEGIDIVKNTAPNKAKAYPFEGYAVVTRIS